MDYRFSPKFKLYLNIAIITFSYILFRYTLNSDLQLCESRRVLVDLESITGQAEAAALSLVTAKFKKKSLL